MAKQIQIHVIPPSDILFFLGGSRGAKAWRAGAEIPDAAVEAVENIPDCTVLYCVKPCRETQYRSLLR